MKSVLELIGLGSNELPRQEIECLLAGLLKRQRYELYLYEETISDKTTQRFFDLVQKRKKGIPIQYLLHSAAFLDLELYVDERVFIPRPETEELVKRTIAKLSSPCLMIEIGTGSGAIALALAKTFPKTKIIATDISQAALEVAQINVELYNFIDRIELIEADLFDLPNYASLYGRVDCIISNPPYINRTMIPLLAPTVKDYEPIKSLDGGQDGFEIVQRIITQGVKFLKPAGLIALEIDPDQKELIMKVKPEARFESDLSGKIRFAFLNLS